MRTGKIFLVTALIYQIIEAILPFITAVVFAGVQGTYSAVLRNIHGDDASFETLYAVLALQMLPHAVGFL